jgi:hypothetical protein
MKRGYGRVNVGGVIRLAHRVAYCKHHGLHLEDIEGMVVRHKCDNPPCVNPEHLELGTQAQNLADMSERGRAPRGTRNGHAKLTEQDVLAIRRAYVPHSRTAGGQALADRYGVCNQTIHEILSRKIWTHL